MGRWATAAPGSAVSALRARATKIQLPEDEGCITVVNVVRGDAHLGRLAGFNSWVLHQARPGLAAEAEAPTRGVEYDNRSESSTWTP